MEKLVSVVLPAFNCSCTIGHVIESLLCQTYKNIELIIINDGSTDDTKDVISSFADERIVLFDLNENSGISVALNKGLELSKGSYIARVDSDDFCETYRIETQVKFLEANSNISVCGTFQRIVGGFNDRLNKTAITNKEIKSALIFSPTMLHSTVMFRRHIIEEFGVNLYNSDYYLCEDYELWSRLSKTVQFYNLPLYLCHYDMRGAKNWQSNSSNLIASLKKIYVNELNAFIKFVPPKIFLDMHLKLVDRSNLNYLSFLQMVCLFFYSGFLGFFFLISPGYSTIYGFKKIFTLMAKKISFYIKHSYLNSLSKK